MPLRRLRCPHCFAEVFVNTDGICPGCRGNVEEAGPGSEGLVPMEFVDGEKLPPVCLLCSAPAEHYVKIGEKNQLEENDKARKIAGFWGHLGGILSFRIGPEPFVTEYKISIELPVCGAHGGSPLLKPLFVDYSRYRITLPAHKEFIKQWKGYPD